MDSPLEEIEHWFLSLKPTHQQDLTALAGHVFFEEGTLPYDRAERILTFIKIFDNTGLSPIEELRKVLFLVKVFDFSLDGRTTEEDWQKSLDRMLEMRSGSQDADDAEIIDQLLSKHPSQKEGWLTIAKSWQKLIDSSISNKSISDWYIIHLGKKIRGNKP